MPTPSLERTTRLVASRDQVSTTLGADTVILGMHDGVYYGVEGSAARIWALLQVERSLGEIADHLVAEYDVEPGRAWEDLCAHAHELLERGLIERSPAPAP